MSVVKKLPSDYSPRSMGDGRRFHVRILNNGWQVYGEGLEHVCDCLSSDAAAMIAVALEQAAERSEGES